MKKLGEYIARESLIHRLDPRIKILFVLGLSIIIINNGLLTLFMLSLFLLSLIPASKLNFSNIIEAIKPITFFFILFFFVHLFFTEGRSIPPFPIYYLDITYEGLYKGLLVIWQFGLLIICASFLTMTTSPDEFISGIERLLRPFNFLRISSHDIAIMISLALRFIPTILEEISTIKDALMARGMNFRKVSVIQKARAIKFLAMPLTTGTIRRGDELADAMEARGYRPGPRTYMKELKISTRDYAAIGVMLFLISLLYVIRFIETENLLVTNFL